MAAEMDISMNVRVFEELTFTKAEPNEIFSVKMRSNYNVLTGHPNKTHDWQRVYFFVKSDEHAFEEPSGDDYRGLWNRQLVRHPNAIAYPEKFFESAQAIAAHSHLFDWESRLPCVLGPRKSRLPLFTRKQQRLLDKAIEMDGVPDLSALLKGKLQLLTKKSTTVDPQGPSDSGVDVTSEGGGASREEASREGASREEGPIATDQGGTAETSASGPKKKKKKTKRTKVRATDEVPPEESAPVNATLTDEVHPEESAPVDATSEGGHPRKKTKRSVEAEPRPSTSDANVADAAIVDAVGEASGTPGPEGFVARRRCAELTRQIRGGTKEMPQLEDLYFKNEYIDAASSRARSDGSMNFLVEKYDSALKQTMIQLGSSEKLTQARLKAIERVRDEHKKANEKAAKEKEVLRVKFEELEGKLKSAGAAKKELARENTRLEQATATLEKEKTELLEERDAAVEKLIRERQRLRDSRGLEVTRERERVKAAMIEKANGCFGRVRDHLTRFDAFGKAKNLYGQASGTRKCLEMIKASGTEIPQEMNDVFIEQEKLYEAEATKLRVDPLSDSDLTLSPLVLPSRFVEDRFRASFDPYGSNVDLIGPGMVSQLITSLEITEEPSEEPLVDVTSVPAERVEVLEGGGPSERTGNENLEEEEAGHVSIEDPVLVSDSSSEGREGEEVEDDRVEETSSLQPVEEEKTDEVGNRDVPPPPAVDSLVSIPTRVEDPTVTEDPVGPSALGTPEEIGQDYAP
ncbi:meiosis-specific protein ASY2-like [Brassica napus]|uniref:meiosis-specific protein ASY2-like n=1 Tax=Brassica napus TaxID=3708 RepID=UPI0020788D2A|nr:meiosis-specific protein ASY2-like [Brassica napus]